MEILKGLIIATAALLIAAPAAFAAPSALANCRPTSSSIAATSTRAGAVKDFFKAHYNDCRRTARWRWSGRRRSARPARPTSSSTAPTSNRARERSRIASSRMPRR